MLKPSKHLLCAALFFVITPAMAGEAEAVTPQEASTMASEHKAVILDVREDKEWQEQHIDGAVHIPLNAIEARASELKKYDKAKIITQCRSGSRSAKAQEILKSAGFSNVYNMEGGLTAWTQSGLATTK